jgi:hypothetical protein
VVLQLYADECVDARVVAGLRRRAVIVTTAADEGLLGATDEQHFARAHELGRVIVTADQDFLRLAQAQLEAGARFPGLVFILPATPVGEAIRAIAVVATVVDPEHMVNWIEWIP